MNLAFEVNLFYIIVVVVKANICLKGCDRYSYK